MLKKKEAEEVKKLIESGFDLELISFELDIPLEKIKQLKKEIEKPREYMQKNKRINSESYHKMIQMKQKYRELFFGSSVDKEVSKIEAEQPKQLSPKDMELIQTVIENIRNKIHLIQSPEKTRKKNNSKRNIR